MRTWLTCTVITLFLGFAVVVGAVSNMAPVVAQEIDREFPPGDPVLGDQRPTNLEHTDDPNYGLWVLVAACLISAGVLLVKIERWEARRIEHNTPSTNR